MRGLNFVQTNQKSGNLNCDNANVREKLLVNGPVQGMAPNGELQIVSETVCVTNDLKVGGTLNGKPVSQQWVIPLSDSITPPAGTASVYLNVEETYNPGGPTGKDPITLLLWDIPAVTVTQVGDMVIITTGSGEPGANLAWTQTNDYSKMYNNVPLVIDFTGTEVENLIAFGGTHPIFTVPGGYDDSVSGLKSEIGIAQIGAGAPIIKIWPEAAPELSGVVTLDGSGQFLVAAANVLAFLPTELNTIGLTVFPGSTPSGFPYVANIDNSGFLIQSSAGATDAGVKVNYRIKPNYGFAFSKGWASGRNAIQNFSLSYALQNPELFSMFTAPLAVPNISSHFHH